MDPHARSGLLKDHERVEARRRPLSRTMGGARPGAQIRAVRVRAARCDPSHLAPQQHGGRSAPQEPGETRATPRGRGGQCRQL
eukprot:scaffold12229_cov32-Tisochrysis_lutea.AAC.8